MGKNTQVNSKTILKSPTQGNDVTTLSANSVATTNLQDLSVTTPKLADGSATFVKLGSDVVRQVLKQYKNYMINGAMEISQRGTSFAAIANGAYSLDRYLYQKQGTTVHTVTQDTDVPTPAQVETATGTRYTYNNSMRLNVTTAQASFPTAFDFVSIGQRIEGYNWANLAQKDFVVSFWVKSSVTGTYSLAARNSIADRSYVAEYTISAANTWEYKQVQIVASPSAGTWNYTNGTGININWTLGINASFTGATNTWLSSNVLGSANQVNAVATIGNDFRLTGVQVQEGTLATPFRLFSDNNADEIRACQRYLPVIRAQGSTVEYIPGSATALNTSAIFMFIFPNEVRTKPTSAVVSAGSHFTFSNNNGNFTASAISYNGSGNATLRSGLFTVTIATVGGTTQGGFIYFNNATAYLYLEGAEL